MKYASGYILGPLVIETCILSLSLVNKDGTLLPSHECIKLESICEHLRSRYNLFWNREQVKSILDNDLNRLFSRSAGAIAMIDKGRPTGSYMWVQGMNDSITSIEYMSTGWLQIAERLGLTGLVNDAVKIYELLGLPISREETQEVSAELDVKLGSVDLVTQV
ncbi:hypothetical protein JW962_02740 [Candidatus Dojkabacteria bacterium]|nr:hypothetical protein [Candidatus Dojkabacteria bacterium]